MADNVKHLRPISTGGEPPNMDERIRHLEQDVSVIKNTMSTAADLNALKAELHQSLNTQTWAINAQTWKIVGAIVGMTAIFSAVVTLLQIFA